MGDDAETEPQSRASIRWLEHELKTQIGHIVGYAELLTEDLCDAGIDAGLADARRISDAARQVATLVDEVLSSTGAPSAIDGPRAIEPTEESTLPPIGSTGRILIVDDNAASRELLARRLTRRGHAVVEENGGASALSRIESERFDLVLLDVMMPVMDGFQTLDAIRATRSMSELPVVMVTALSAGDDIVQALQHLANDYITKPVDLEVLLARVETQLALRCAALEIDDLAQKLAIRNAFLRKTFGRFVSDDVVDDLLDRDDGLQFSLERRRVSVLMADIRGFTALTERLPSHESSAILNRYVEAMTDVIEEYHGLVDNIMGDGILALFGAFGEGVDDALRSVECALAMQRTLGAVNEEHRSRGLASVEVGIGIATGDVLVGNIGSERRSKHTALGSTVNLASRIETFTAGGEILISAATFEDVKNLVIVDEFREIQPKGFDGVVIVRRVSRSSS